MKCLNCGTELPNDAQFCGSCGAIVAQPQTVPAADTQPQTAATQQYAANAVEPPLGELPSYSAAVPLVKKKKSKLVPALIAAGSVAVVGTAGAFIGVNNQGAIKRTFMGDQDYAAHVMDNTVERYTGTRTKEENVATIKNVSAAVIRTAATFEDFEGTEEEMMLYAAATAAEAYGVDGVSMIMGIDAQLSEDFKELLADLCGKELEISNNSTLEVIEYLSNLYVSVDEKKTEDAFACALRFGSSTELASADFYYTADGNAYLSFPNATETAVTMPLPEFTFEEESEPEVELDEQEIQEFLDELEKVIDAALEKTEVEIEDGKLSVGDAEFEGTCVQSEFDAELIGETFVEIAKVVEDSAFMAEFMEAYMGEDYDLSTLVEEAQAASDSIVEGDFTLYVRNYVTAADKVVGTQIAFGDDEAEITFSTMGTEEYFAVEFELEEETGYDDMVLSLVAEKKTENSGMAVISYEMPNEGLSFDFNIEYSELGTADLFGTQYPTGVFEMSLGDSVVDAMELDGETFMIGDKEYDLEDVVGGTSFVVKCLKQGSGIRMDVAIENDEFGYIGMYYALDKSLESVPTSYKTTITVDELTGEKGEKLVDEIVSYYVEKIYNLPAVSGIMGDLGFDSCDSMLEGMGYESVDQLADDVFDELYYELS